MNVNIGLVQFKVMINEPFKETAIRVEKFIKLAVRNKCKIICFPEDFWYGPLEYYKDSLINKLTDDCSKKIIKLFCLWAKKYQINIIAGTIIQKINKKIFNICYVINKQGNIILNYAKRRLVPYGFENEKITKGEKISKVVNLAGIKIGVLICRELFYSGLFYDLRKKGAEIIFVPSFWPKRSSDYAKHQLRNNYKIISEMRVVDALCEARSFENEAVIAYINAPGYLKNKKDYDVLLGRTQVCFPFYGCVKKINQNKEGMIIFTYDGSIVTDARDSYHLFNRNAK